MKYRDGSYLDFESKAGVALARASDPQTSKQSAAAIVDKLGDLEQWAVNCVSSSPGKTQRELGAIYCPSDLRRIGRRLSSLVDRGRLRRGEARKCSITGRNASTWWLAGLPNPTENDANDLRKYAKACRVLAGLTEKNKQFSSWVVMSDETRNGQMSRKDIREEFLRIAKRMEQAAGGPLAAREGQVSAEQAGRLMALAIKRELIDVPEVVRQSVSEIDEEPMPPGKGKQLNQTENDFIASLWRVRPYYFFRIAVSVWLSKLQPEGE